MLIKILNKVSSEEKNYIRKFSLASSNIIINLKT